MVPGRYGIRSGACYETRVKRVLVAVVAVLGIACGSSTPTPVVGTPLTITQLKFAVLDAVGPPAYCDPDYYPIARPGNEQTNAITRYPEIRVDAELYSTILANEHLPSGELTDEQKLAVYRAWKLLRAVALTQDGSDYAFSYRVQSKGGMASYVMVTGTVRVDGVVTVASRTPSGPPNCPICLAAATLIATPKGPVRVTDIRLGMLVWTAAPDGTRLAAPVLAIGSMEVPAGHMMVHLVLTDGRELLASPGHRASDGRLLGALVVGDTLDGSTIKELDLTPYAGDRTYDLLPGGQTGRYWANGILLSTTLTASGS